MIIMKNGKSILFTRHQRDMTEKNQQFLRIPQGLRVRVRLGLGREVVISTKKEV